MHAEVLLPLAFQPLTRRNGLLEIYSFCQLTSQDMGASGQLAALTLLELLEFFREGLHAGLRVRCRCHCELCPKLLDFMKQPFFSVAVAAI